MSEEQSLGIQPNQREMFIKSFYKGDRIGNNQELTELDEIITKFPPKAKKFLSFLTSTFLEKDVYEAIMNDQRKVGKIKKTFAISGLDERQINSIMHYFEKSHSKSESSIEQPITK